MEILTATHAHIGQISALYERFFAYNAAQQPEFYRTAREKGEYPLSVIESETEELFVAVENEAVMGILHISEKHTPPFPCYVPYRYAEIIDLFIAPDYRGQGIGVSLLDRARAWAKDRNLSYLELSLLKNNVDGVRFYEREHFQETTCVMRRPL